MIPAYLSPLANHLWQSTLFAAVAGLLTLTLRRNHAQARYALWLVASVKFLFPFAVLVQAGSHFGWNALGTSKPPVGVSNLADQMSQPFALTVSTNLATGAAPATANLWPVLLFGVWACGFAVVSVNWWRRWRRLQHAARMATPLPLDGRGIRVMSSPTLLEPGVLGILRPVLLLPEGILGRLSSEQFAAILEHEYCHVQRRDNLAAAIHMAVEAVFWFHPLVWWIERQLVKERERACDEEVLRRGNDPEVYAEAILRVCRFCVELPMVCVAGVAGGDLKQRIGAIMTHRVVEKLTVAKKVLLTAAGFAAVAAPTFIGMIDAQTSRAQAQPATRLAFEVASVKTNKSTDFRSTGMQFLPGGRMVVRNLPLQILITAAYDLPFQSDRLTGGPGAILGERYDIEATAEKGAIPEGLSPKVFEEKMRLMLQTLLAERFKLIIRRELRERPIYAVVVAKGGPKLEKATIEEKDCQNGGAFSSGGSCHNPSGGQGRGIHGGAIDLSDVALFVSNWADRPVIDQTGLRGLYNIQTDGWAPMRPRPARPLGQEPTAEDLAFADPTRPTLFTIFDRLGLKLESTKGPVEMFVIESVERPAEN